jgi:hypothetical protein
MEADANGWIWFVIDVVAVLILAGLIAYGSVSYRRYRNRVSDAERDRATREVFKSADRTSGDIRR